MEELGGFPMERKKGKGKSRKKERESKFREGRGRLIYSKKLWCGKVLVRRDGESEEEKERGRNHFGRKSRAERQRGVDERNKQKQLSSSIGSARFTVNLRAVMTETGTFLVVDLASGRTR